MARRDRNQDPRLEDLQFVKNWQWFVEHRERLDHELPGQFVAVCDEQVVDSGPYLSVVADRVKEHRGHTDGVYFDYLGPDLEAELD